MEKVEKYLKKHDTDKSRKHFWFVATYLTEL